MIKRAIFLFYFINFILINTSLAVGVSCQGLFAKPKAPTLGEALELINNENKNTLKVDLISKEFLQDREDSLSFFKKRSLKNLLKKVNVDDALSEQAMERYAVDLAILLFGDRSIVDRWIKKEASQRLRESFYDVAKTQLIKEGLVKVWADHYDLTLINARKKILDRMWRVLNSRYLQLLGVPFWLPKVSDQQISKELIFKVFQDGYEVHELEVARVMKSQNRREAYNAFRRIYIPVLFALSLSLAYDNYKASIEAQVQMTIVELKEQRQQLEIEIPKVKMEEARAAYEKSIKKFIQHWGEEPTKNEKIQIKKQIEMELKLANGALSQE